MQELIMIKYGELTTKKANRKIFINTLYQNIQKVLKIIEDSDLEESMKQNLKNAVLIGNASYRLWNVEDNL